MKESDKRYPLEWPPGWKMKKAKQRNRGLVCKKRLFVHQMSGQFGMGSEAHSQ